jgi:hypothetical protein
MISSCAFCADHATLIAPHAATLAATLADADGDHHAADSTSLATSLADADASLAANADDANEHHAADPADLAANLATHTVGSTDLAANAVDCNSSSVASPSAYRSATSTAALLRLSVSRSHTTRPSWSGVLRTHQHANNRNSRSASAIHTTVRRDATHLSSSSMIVPPRRTRHTTGPGA